ncbi:Ketosteroid isomerase-related protein [Bradyrhizobium sp. Rc2d]|nr:Ketosteroid isomerase-related protein [Bradyrhizobium sp. Rc2d]
MFSLQPPRHIPTLPFASVRPGAADFRTTPTNRHRYRASACLKRAISCHRRAGSAKLPHWLGHWRATVAPSNLEVFRSIIDRGFSGGDLSVADEVCAERLLEHQYLTPTDLPGPAILKSQIESARRNLKDFKLKLEAWVETEDTVWARCRATGTDPGSGKPVAIDVLDICRFKNGKLIEHWGVPDRFALLHQIGALPSPPT